MSRFYTEIQGNRGGATRQGSEKSGIEGHIRGWDIGARVSMHTLPTGEDYVRVEITGGSRNPSCLEIIGNFTRRNIDEEVSRKTVQANLINSKWGGGKIK